MAEHECDSGNFDRTICPLPCGAMHSYCDTCGRLQDRCAHDAPDRTESPTEGTAGVLAAHECVIQGLSRDRCRCGWMGDAHRAHLAAVLDAHVTERCASAWANGYRYGVEDMTGTETLTVARRNPYRAAAMRGEG